ncbi:hypothetical protein COLO4_28850 [Corchorus olitorius]|uniref:Uncharacterized protein n=1 Tax=Corchorus olitorius TaxID=93759 RepID=A0A1R3HHU9_9ROSI|nr:hypothetical protein COLO4_28850 [Corchorus olitorius]
MKVDLGSIKMVDLGSRTNYIGGDVWEMDMDLEWPSFQQFNEIVTDGLGCQNVHKLFYCIPGKPFKKELRLIRDDIEMFAFGWIIRKYGSIDIYVEHSVAEPVLAPMQIEYEKENLVEGVENPRDGFENPVDGVENPVDDDVGNPIEEVEMPGNGDDAEIDEGDDVQVDHEERVIDGAVNVEDVNEEGRKDGEELSVKKSKDKRLEFLNESGYFVEIENSSGNEDDEETKYARRGFRQAKYQMIRELGIEGIRVDVEHVGVDPINKYLADYDLREDAGYPLAPSQGKDKGPWKL